MRGRNSQHDERSEMMIRTLLAQGAFFFHVYQTTRLAADSQTIADLISYGLKTAAQGAGFESY